MAAKLPASVITIGEVGKTHGHRGAVKIKVTPATEELIQENRFLFLMIRSKPVPFFIEELTDLPKLLAVKFADVDSIEAAEKLHKLEIALPAEEVPEEVQDVVVLSHLQGFLVRTEDGSFTGTVKDVIENPMQDMLVVESDGREHLIPLHRDFIVEADPQKKLLVLDLPEGLVE